MKGLLPPIEGYRWMVIKRENQILQPKQSDILFDHGGSGYFVFAYLETDTPEIEVITSITGGGSIDIMLSPKKLYEAGALSPSPGAAYLTRYDTDCTANCKYIGMYTPSPWLPFSERSSARIYNPTYKTARYTFLAYLYVKV